MTMHFFAFQGKGESYLGVSPSFQSVLEIRDNKIIFLNQTIDIFCYSTPGKEELETLLPHLNQWDQGRNKTRHTGRHHWTCVEREKPLVTLCQAIPFRLSLRTCFPKAKSIRTPNQPPWLSNWKGKFSYLELMRVFSNPLTFLASPYSRIDNLPAPTRTSLFYRMTFDWGTKPVYSAIFWPSLSGTKVMNFFSKLLVVVKSGP